MAATRNKPLTELQQGVAAFLATHLLPDEPVCLGLSGGCDSVVLLHLLKSLAGGRELHVLHINHGLSGNADRWTDFCRSLTLELGVTFTAVSVEVERASRSGLEAAARFARYEAFAASGYRNIFLAHHAGDQAETLLFNLLRGAGVSGLAAMPAERVTGNVRFLRPLLPFSRSDIENFARREQLEWIHDESNDDTHFSRNFIRHDVLPVIKERFPAAEKALFSAASHCAEADDLVGQLAEMDWRALAEGECVNMRRLRTLSLVRLKNLLRYRLRRLGWRVPEASRLGEFARQLLEAAPDRHPSLEMPDGCMLVKTGGLHWVRQK